MRIEISEYRVVQKITCVSSHEIETDNFVALYGLHEVLLNNMVARSVWATIARRETSMLP